MGKCAGCQIEAPEHLLLRFRGALLCNDCYEQRRDTGWLGLHRPVLVALAVAAGSVVMCTIAVDGRDWGAVGMGALAGVFGARALGQAKALTVNRRRNMAVAAAAIAIGAWRIAYGLGLLAGL